MPIYKTFFFFFSPVVDWYMVLLLKSDKGLICFYSVRACLCLSLVERHTCIYEWHVGFFFFFHFQSISLIYSLVHENTGIRFAAQVFSFLPPRPGSKFALTILHWLNFLSLFSVEMFWSLLQVLIPSSSLTPSTSGECGIVDKSSWQHSKSNHFPPDVRVWEGTKREWKEGGIRGEKPAAATASSTHIHEVTYSSLPETPNIISFTPLCWKTYPPFSFSVLHILPPYTPGGS